MPVFVALLLLAADIDGVWTRSVGRQVQKLTLKSEGETFTGNLETSGGRVAPLNVTDGKIDGAKVSFTIVRESGESKLTLTFTGSVSDTDLKLTMTTTGGSAKEPPVEQVFVKSK